MTGTPEPQPPKTDPAAALLAALLPRLNAMTLKRPALALGLWGPAGIGKTHLARRLLSETACRGFGFHAAQPLSALVRGLPRPASLPAWAEPLLDRLGRGESVEPDPAASALAALLAAVAPVVLHLEDLHEAPPERLELTRKLARTLLRGRGVALLVTSRTEPLEPFEAHALRPLGEAGARGLLEGEVGSPLPEEALGWIYRRAGGNPLFTLEYLRHLARQGFLWNDGRKWRWRPPPAATVPLTVEALIERELREAVSDPARRRVLESGAFLGPGADDRLWAGVAELPPQALSEARLGLERLGVFRAGGFAHPLYREVASGGLEPEARRAYARRALEALKHDPRRAAEFVREAGLDEVEARGLFLRAAEAAGAAGNPLQQARLLAGAAGYAHGEERGRIALEAARVLQHHDLPEAARLTGLALRTPAATPEDVRFYAHVLARQGRVPELEDLLQTLPPRLRASVDAASLAVTTHNIGGNHAQALAAFASHPELQADPPPELLRAVAASAAATGRMEQAQALTAQGLARVTDPALRCEFLSVQALIFFHSGDYLRAEATLGEALRLLDGLDAPRLRGTALVNRAAFLKMLGRYAEMGECLEAALKIRREAGDPKAYAFAQASLAELRVEQGRYEEAEDLIAEAVGTLELYGPSRFLTNAHSIACVLHLARPAPMSGLLALKHAEQALAYARREGNPRVVREILFDASVSHTRLGNPAQGLRLAEEALGLAEAAGDSPLDNLRTRWAMGVALGALGEPQRAAELLREAQAVAGEVGADLEAQKIGLELDRIGGNAESAGARLAWFEARGLISGANLARRYFPELSGGEDSPPARPGAEGAKPLRLEILGPLRFDGEPLKGRKRQELLALLAEARVAGRAEVGKLELLDALYPGEDEEKAASSLKELIRTVRASLGAPAIATTASGYALGDGVGSDAEEFLRTGDPALWRGAYLEGLSGFDGAVRESVHLALRSRVEALLDTDPKEAARLGRVLLDADPYDTGALRLALEALRGSQNHKTLGRIYGEAKARMAELGEVLPEAWQSFLGGSS